ncbi:MAG: M56 family metallopeptidase [Gammaproteobacteria bacterium]|nr:M56 family metallopeptidase [Gammaproteobacteria bacterium]
MDIAQTSLLLMLLDLLFKSTLVIGLNLLVIRVITKRSSSSHKHLLWVSGVLCLALLPLIPLLQEAVPGATDEAVKIFNISVFAESAQLSTERNVTQYGFLLLTLPTIFLFVRLCLSLQRVLRISRNAELVYDKSIKASVHRIREMLQISREVSIRQSSAISSPFSFGLLRPSVILPITYSQWSDSVLEDVLVHELSHIRRLDWLSMLLCQVVLCVYWFNPLVWLAVRKVDEEAENSCDAAVIRCGKSNTEYAENLLLVARECRNQKRLLAQMMVDRKLLSNRITTILENPMMMKTISRKMIALSVAMAATLLVGLGNVQLLDVQAQASDQEMLPLNQSVPLYPRRAAEAKIEGWVQVHFDVTPQGTVDVDSIVVVDSEPAGVFDNSALKATPGFTFSPRLVNGEAVEVKRVQYVFKYQLTAPPEGQAWPDSYTGRPAPGQQIVPPSN